ncbi:MAG: AAA family ATPase [Saprospiraceae bacterium]|nr:AAA family ATPase [Saprospiraceae bacterium]
MSIFSDLNNLKDISIHPHYNSLVGISQLDVEQYLRNACKRLQRNKINPMKPCCWM